MRRLALPLLVLCGFALGRIHDLHFDDDNRAIIDLSSFAYNDRGMLHVNVTKFQLSEDDFKSAFNSANDDFEQLVKGKAQIGFILEKLNSQGSIRSNKNHGDITGGAQCLLHEPGQGQGMAISLISHKNED